ncbi:hypothetical protein WJX73_004909 [Symbiochloris irregularis]|uniref:Uncharacterized protein n=1 Tax=Symbiochloris irregularis TaxID=706552 RepID=A0AAW1NMY4_9CHLO
MSADQPTYKGLSTALVAEGNNLQKLHRKITQHLESVQAQESLLREMLQQAKLAQAAAQTEAQSAAQPTQQPDS